MMRCVESFEFSAAHPVDEEGELYVEAAYTPEERPSLYSPGECERVEILSVRDHAGHPFTDFDEGWLEGEGLKVARRRIESAELERYLARRGL